MKTTLSVAVALGLAVPVLAQGTTCGDSAINTMFGVALGGGDDASFPVTSSFPIIFPDGTSTTDIEITTNGRIFPVGGDGVDFSPSAAEFAADTTQIAGAWLDMTFDPGATSTPDQVYLNDLGSSLLITWNDARTFPGDTLFTIQVELFPNGDARFAYDSRFNPADALSLGGDGVSGFSAGALVPDPGPSDLTSLPAPSANTVYEVFNQGSNPFDLPGLELSTSLVPTGGIAFVSNCALNSSVGQACPTANDATTIYELFDAATIADLDGVELLFLPNMAGGYIVSQVTGQTLAPVAPTDLMLGDDAVAPVLLSAPIPVPGGGTTTDLEVDSNGSVYFSLGNGSDFSPTVDEFINGNARVSIWEDLSPNQGGMVNFEEIGGVAVISWVAVPFFGTTTNVDMQVQLRPDGSILIAITSFQNPDTALIGITQGAPNAFDGGEVDFSVATPFDSGASINAPSLDALSAPVLGTTLDLQVTGLSNLASIAFIQFGLFNPMIDLSNFGAPGCMLMTDGQASVPVPVANGDSIVLSVNVPNNLNLVGLSVFTQGAALDPGNTSNMFSASFTNGIQSTFNVN